ncbi:MAG TPA: hypothetical protein VHM30_15465, partial [Gemmatimonadaceae bacterium]|nr:hypothetical protein [Gemmatimonadaceae bacterium]
VVAIGLFSSLNVRVTEQSVVWRFGPGLFGGRIPLAEIDDVTVGRTPLWAGLGIHWIWSGWVYNVSGRGAVRIERRGGGTTWLGSDEPEALRDAIESARRR